MTDKISESPLSGPERSLLMCLGETTGGKINGLILKDQTYISYRGGEFANPNSDLRLFDATTRFLFGKRDLSIIRGGRKIGIAKKAKHPDLLHYLHQITGSLGVNSFGALISQSAERISDEIKGENNLMRPLVFPGEPNARESLGMILGWGFILTEETRQFLQTSGKLKQQYRVAIANLHPDTKIQSSGQRLEEWTKGLNAAYKILSTPSKFKKWLNGEALFSI